MKIVTGDEKDLQFLNSPRKKLVFYLAYLFHFVSSVSTVTTTNPPTFIRGARGLGFVLCNVASYSGKRKNRLECLLVNWLEEDGILVTKILLKISTLVFVHSCLWNVTSVRKGTNFQDNMI